jgi:glycosyltransferase involved in cell wall biosynthesis
MLIIYIGNFLGKQKGFYAGPNQWIVDSLLSKNYIVKHTSSKLSKIGRLLDFFKLIVKERNNADLAFIDTYSSQAFFFAFIASILSKFFKIKYILILHGGDLPARFTSTPKLSKYILKNAYKVVSPSEYLFQATKDAFGIEPQIIRNPVEIVLYRFKQRDITNPVLLWVRSFQAVYNPQMAIEVVHKLKLLYPKIQLYFVGPDKSNMLPEIQMLINEKKLNDNISIKGKLTLEQWMSLSEKCNIFINTTHKDNTPVSLLEAMALGLPIVSTRVGGIPYLVEEDVDALCCEDGNADEMSTKIEELILNKEKTRNIITNARNKVEKKYNSEIVLQQWLNLINSVHNKS